MISYSNEGILPFPLDLLRHWRGSVVPKAFISATGPALLSVLIWHWNRSNMGESLHEKIAAETVDSTQLFAAMSATLIVLIGFRSSKAYSRFWEGTTLLNQMWGEWFDAASCLVSFTTLSMRTKPKEVMEFRHTLIRLISLMHASALDEISGIQDEPVGFESLDLGGLDENSLRYLWQARYELKFNRVEVLIHMIQILVVHCQDNGILKIPPPILSRVFQTLSRGQVNLANAKKITTTLFPFPYAQLIAVLMIVYAIFTPVVMAGACEKAHWAFIFTLLPCAGTFSMNYIARELEMPFGDDSNDLPLHGFQEHMNNSMLMLIRAESDHIASISQNCEMEYHALTEAISGKRPKDFLSQESKRPVSVFNAGPVIATPPTEAPPPPAAPAPAAAAPAPAAAPQSDVVDKKILALEKILHDISFELDGKCQVLKRSADLLSSHLQENAECMKQFSQANGSRMGANVDEKANGSSFKAHRSDTHVVPTRPIGMESGLLCPRPLA